jgi:hypothetical protein
VFEGLLADREDVESDGVQRRMIEDVPAVEDE